MGLRLVLIGSLLGLLTAAPAMAADRTLSVTIYAGDLALVQDRRDVEIKGGRQRLEFQDVSAQIRPETVSLTAADISIVEQNFDFDLLTPAKLMEKAVGRQITIVRVNPATGAETREQAQVLATNGGVVLKIGERIEVLRDDGLPVRVIFDKVPENLRAQPTLSVTVDCFGSTKIEAKRLASGPKVAALPWANWVVASYQSKEVTPGAESFISPAHSSKPFLIFLSVKRGFQS